MRVERLSQDNGAGTWAVVGDVDIFATAKLHAVLQEELKAEHDVVLYLSQVTFLDSTGLGTLWGGAKRASTRGMRFALRANASVPVMQILDLAGARDRFEWVSAGGATKLVLASESRDVPVHLAAAHLRQEAPTAKASWT